MLPRVTGVVFAVTMSIGDWETPMSQRQNPVPGREPHALGPEKNSGDGGFDTKAKF